MPSPCVAGLLADGAVCEPYTVLPVLKQAWGPTLLMPNFLVCHGCVLVVAWAAASAVCVGVSQTAHLVLAGAAADLLVPVFFGSIAMTASEVLSAALYAVCDQAQAMSPHMSACLGIQGTNRTAMQHRTAASDVTSDPACHTTGRLPCTATWLYRHMCRLKSPRGRLTVSLTGLHKHANTLV